MWKQKERNPEMAPLVEQTKIKLSKEGSGVGHKQCPICGKIFYIESSMNWTYKRFIKGHTNYLCGYGCARVIDKQNEGNKKSKFKRGC